MKKIGSTMRLLGGVHTTLPYTTPQEKKLADSSRLDTLLPYVYKERKKERKKEKKGS